MVVLYLPVGMQFTMHILMQHAGHVGYKASCCSLGCYIKGSNGALVDSAQLPYLEAYSACLFYNANRALIYVSNHCPT